MVAQSSLMVQQRGAIAPLEHRRDTPLRVDKPKHDKGSEKAAHGGYWKRVDMKMWAACACMVWC